MLKTIKEEERLVLRERMFLVGISQGFATYVFVHIFRPRPQLFLTLRGSRVLAVLFADGKGGFAGLCGFCGWFPLADESHIHNPRTFISPRAAYQPTAPVSRRYK